VQAIHGLDQPIHVFTWEKQPRLALPDDLRIAPYRAYHDWQASAHRFENGHGSSFAETCHCKEVDGARQAPRIVPEARKLHARRQPKFADPGLDAGPLRPLAHDEKPQVRVTLPQDTEST